MNFMYPSDYHEPSPCPHDHTCMAGIIIVCQAMAQQGSDMKDLIIEPFSVNDMGLCAYVVFYKLTCTTIVATSNALDFLEQHNK